MHIEEMNRVKEIETVKHRKKMVKGSRKSDWDILKKDHSMESIEFGIEIDRSQQRIPLECGDSPKRIYEISSYRQVAMIENTLAAGSTRGWGSTKEIEPKRCDDS